MRIVRLDIFNSCKEKYSFALPCFIKRVMKMYSLYVFTSVIVGILSQSDPLVTISDGAIRGQVVNNGVTAFWAFKGIPYAKPPVESLRLKDPEPPEKWPSTLVATNYKSKCPQQDSQGNVVGEENCLYINVFNPLVKGSVSSNIPVMVFIHGGNFKRGSADMYGPEQLVASGNQVVLVTFDYRIGLLGFLSTGDETCPGNLGLKDQVMALNWVRQNIEKFGGDPNSITLFGQGSGAVSVFLHILSPKSKNLFHKAITQSGSPLCNWTLAENPHSYAVEVAERLRCPTKSMSLMVECIRQKPIKELVEAQNDNKTFGDYPLRMAPVVEKDFLPDTPENLLKSGNFPSIPLLSGVNKDDGTFFYPLMKSYQDDMNRNSTFLLNQLIPMFLRNTTDLRNNIEFVSLAIYFQYFDGIDPTNTTQVLQSFINMTTDSMFVTCNHKTIESYSAKGAKVYTYTFEYKGEDSMLDFELGQKTDYKGVSHGDELLYLFDIETPSFKPNINIKVQNMLIYLWTTFAKNGELSGLSNQYPKWDPYTTESKYYYELNFNPEEHTSYKQENINFWLNYLPNVTRIEMHREKDVSYKVGGFGWAMLVIAIVLMIVVAALAVILWRKSKNQYSSTKTEEK